MESLPFSSPTSNLSAPPRSSSSRPIFPKQSHFITHAKRSHRLHVSCKNQTDSSSAAQNADAGKRIDRRNMLLGLGGLYGAANLVSSPGASAEPVPGPELDKCHRGIDYNSKEFKQLDEKCCLNIDTIIDYELPPVDQMKERPSAHEVSPEYIFKYETAIDLMKRLPKDDPRSFMQQANVHCAYCNAAYFQAGTDDIDLQIHHNWLFFPFHRWYLYFFERILGTLIDDPTFALPFWNWDNPKGMTVPPMFLDLKSSLYDAKRDPATANSTRIVDLGMTNISDPDQLKANNIAEMYREMHSGNNAYDFLGMPYRKWQGSDKSGQGLVERGSHNIIHSWIGTKENSNEDMGNFYSAGRDPLFYSHHANVDRMWSLWQYVRDPDFLKDPGFLNASFLFWDEKPQLVRVTVKDCLDHQKMGYNYFQGVELPWLDYKPPHQTEGARAKRADIAKKAYTPKKAAYVFPLNLDKITRVEIPKTKTGKADELLVIEGITVDTSKFVKFDVFVNDEEEDVSKLNKASYAGTFSQVSRMTDLTSIRLKLTDLYEYMDVEGDETVVVTLVPRHEGPGVIIGGIKIIENRSET